MGTLNNTGEETNHIYSVFFFYFMFHTGLQRRSIHHHRNVSSYIKKKKKTSYKTRAACRPCTCGGGWSAKRSIQSIIIRKSTLLGPVGDAVSRQRSCLLVAAHRMDVFKGQILQGERAVTMTFSVPKYLMSPPKRKKLPFNFLSKTCRKLLDSWCWIQTSWFDYECMKGLHRAAFFWSLRKTMKLSGEWFGTFYVYIFDI